MYHLKVLEARGQKSRTATPRQRSWEASAATPSDLGLPGPLLPPPLPLLFRLKSPRLSPTRTRAIGLRAQPGNPGRSHLKSLNPATSAKIFFPNTRTFTGPGGSDVDISSGGSCHPTHRVDEATHALGFEGPRCGGTPVVQRNLRDLRKKPRPHPAHPACSASHPQGEASRWRAVGAGFSPDEKLPL